MCRIAGIISNQLTAAELLQKTHAMCKTLAHGGPDDEGTYYAAETGLAFGHRRLAIIDLTPNGHQPMADAGQQTWITFNGEIYNYRQLKAELLKLGATFHSDTDTEVIIQAYLKWGTNGFSRLRGMFAFALYDSVQRLTYLVRDSSGIKPVYYCTGSGQLCFASEVKALKNAGLATEPDPHWPIRFLAFGHIPEPYTTLKNVFSLPKGHFLRWDHQTSAYAIRPFLLTHEQTAAIGNENEAKQTINSELHKTIERQLLADAPIGVFLSGGVDSSLLTMLAYQHKKADLKTVSIFFDEQAYNERRYQNIILAKTNTANYAHLVKQHDFEEALPHIIADMDMPTTDGINTWFISKYAQQNGLKAVLSGLGADEIFGGYPSFRRIKYLRYLKKAPRFLLHTIARLSMGPLKRIALLTHNHPLAEYLFLRGLFVPEDIAAILNIPEKQVTDVLFSAPLVLGDMSDEQKASWFETNLYMQNQLLRDTDVMSMAHGVEVRVPFLDEDFQQLTARIKPDIRFNNKQQKKLLIDSFDSLLPNEIWNRPKMGFTFPLQEWMRRHTQISDVHFYKGKAVQKFIKRFRNRGVHWSRAFALYQLQLQETGPQLPPKKVLLLTLETFSATGGIQKMSRTMAYTLQQIANKRHWKFSMLSGYDHSKDADSSYIEPVNFKGFNQNRSLFALNAFVKGLQVDVVILSHINLALVGWLIKLFKPGCKIWIVAHGIEVWRPLNGLKQRLLPTCDKIICVSHFTKQKVVDLHRVNPDKCIVLNNALDPSMKLPSTFTKPDYLLKHYGLKPENKVIFTLTRLASTEQYKGYEQVIKVVGLLKDRYPHIRYILSGKYDHQEGSRIMALIKKNEVEEQVIVTGFINEAELEDHFLLADMFVLPSKKEGFGIVFIEALACGLPVICGNSDGSIDAIKNGELGTAINVDDLQQLENAIINHLNTPLTAHTRHELQGKCLAHFNTPKYEQDLAAIFV